MIDVWCPQDAVMVPLPRFSVSAHFSPSLLAVPPPPTNHFSSRRLLTNIDRRRLIVELSRRRQVVQVRFLLRFLDADLAGFSNPVMFLGAGSGRRQQAMWFPSLATCRRPRPNPRNPARTPKIRCIASGCSPRRQHLDQFRFLVPFLTVIWWVSWIPKCSWEPKIRCIASGYSPDGSISISFASSCLSWLWFGGFLESPDVLGSIYIWGPRNDVITPLAASRRPIETLETSPALSWSNLLALPCWIYRFREFLHVLGGDIRGTGARQEMILPAVHDGDEPHRGLCWLPGRGSDLPDGCSMNSVFFGILLKVITYSVILLSRQIYSCDGYWS